MWTQLGREGAWGIGEGRSAHWGVGWLEKENQKSALKALTYERERQKEGETEGEVGAVGNQPGVSALR